MNSTRNFKAFEICMAGTRSLREAFYKVDRSDAARHLRGIDTSCARLVLSCDGNWIEGVHARYRVEVVQLLTAVRHGDISRSGYKVGLENTNLHMCEAGVDPVVRTAINNWGCAFFP